MGPDRSTVAISRYCQLRSRPGMPVSRFAEPHICPDALLHLLRGICFTV